MAMAPYVVADLVKVHRGKEGGRCNLIFHRASEDLRSARAKGARKLRTIEIHTWFRTRTSDCVEDLGFDPPRADRTFKARIGIRCLP